MLGGSLAKICICASSIIIRDNRVLLLWHDRLGIWLYPGGHTEENETPQQTAIRETLEETGMKVRIAERREKDKFRFDDAYQCPMPFMIVYEYVPYKTGMHEHFDMVYIAKLENEKELKNLGKGEKVRIRWFGEAEIDGIKTFDNVKEVLHRAFAAV